MKFQPKRTITGFASKGCRKVRNDVDLFCECEGKCRWLKGAPILGDGGVVEYGF